MPTWITDPVKFRTFNGWATIFWIAMIPVSVVMGWIDSVAYVSALSIYALVTGHLSTWQTSRVEVRQDEDSTERIVQEIKQYLKDSDQV